MIRFFIVAFTLILSLPSKAQQERLCLIFDGTDDSYFTTRNPSYLPKRGEYLKFYRQNNCKLFNSTSIAQNKADSLASYIKKNGTKLKNKKIFLAIIGHGSKTHIMINNKVDIEFREVLDLAKQLSLNNDVFLYNSSCYSGGHLAYFLNDTMDDSDESVNPENLCVATSSNPNKYSYGPDTIINAPQNSDWHFFEYQSEYAHHFLWGVDSSGNWSGIGLDRPMSNLYPEHKLSRSYSDRKTIVRENEYFFDLYQVLQRVSLKDVIKVEHFDQIQEFLQESETYRPANLRPSDQRSQYIYNLLTWVNENIRNFERARYFGGDHFKTYFFANAHFWQDIVESLRNRLRDRMTFYGRLTDNPGNKMTKNFAFISLNRLIKIQQELMISLSRMSLGRFLNILFELGLPKGFTGRTSYMRLEDFVARCLDILQDNFGENSIDKMTFTSEQVEASCQQISYGLNFQSLERSLKIPNPLWYPEIQDGNHGLLAIAELTHSYHFQYSLGQIQTDLRIQQELRNQLVYQNQQLNHIEDMTNIFFNHYDNQMSAFGDRMANFFNFHQDYKGDVFNLTTSEETRNDRIDNESKVLNAWHRYASSMVTSLIEQTSSDEEALRLAKRQQIPVELIDIKRTRACLKWSRLNR